MISGAQRGAGGAALGSHLADTKQLNEATELGQSRGLISETIKDQVAELTNLASHSRSTRPLYHMHADPPPGASWDEGVWSRYWMSFEREFGLQRAPFTEVRHTKNGRDHRHRVYSLVRPDGTTESMHHDFARREKLSRLMEHATGAAFVPGAHNRAVVAALEHDGRADVAQAMRAAGLDTMARPRADRTPTNRAQAERTGVDPAAVGAAALSAWKASDGGQAFVAAIADRGLWLAQGDKVILAIDSAGAAHPLARMLGKASKSMGADRIAAAAVAARLAGISLPFHVPGRPTAVPAAALQPGRFPGHPSATPGADGAVDPLLGPSNPRMGAQAPPLADVEALAYPKGAAVLAKGTRKENALTQAPLVPGARRKENGSVRPSPPTAIRGEATEAPAAGGSADDQLIDAAQEGHAPALHDLTDIRFAAAGMARQPNRSPNGGHDGGPADPEPPPIHRQSGNGAGNIRRSEDRQNDGRAHGSVGVARAAGGGGAAPAGSGHRAADGDRRGDRQGGAAAGRARVSHWRAGRYLAAAADAHADTLAELTRRLRTPPTAASIEREYLADARLRATQQLEASARHTATVMAGEPWRDPASRDTRMVATDLHEARMETSRERDRVAAATRAAADAAKGRIGILDRLVGAIGIQSKAVREANQAEAYADVAASARDQGDPLRAELRGVDHTAKAMVLGREAERTAWRARPIVAKALRQALGDDLVRQVIAVGETAIINLAGQDLDAAREFVLAREAQQVRAATAALSWQQLDAAVPEAIPIAGVRWRGP